MSTTVTIEYDPTNVAARKLIEAVKASGLMLSVKSKKNPKPQTYSEIDPALFHQLMDKSMEEYKRGDYINSETLLKEIETW